MTSNGDRYIAKLIQLERVLAVLLFKVRQESSDPSLQIYHIVAVAGIAVPTLKLKNVRNFLQSNQNPLSLIHQLYLLGRFAVYKKEMTKRGGDDFLDALSEDSTHLRKFGQIERQKEQEREFKRIEKQQDHELRQLERKERKEEIEYLEFRFNKAKSSGLFDVGEQWKTRLAKMLLE